MKIFLNVILIIFVLSFLPIPCKFKIYISNDVIYIKLYKFTIFKKLLNKSSSNDSSKETAHSIKEEKQFNKNEKNFYNLSNSEKLKLISIIEKNKFKPVLRINGFVNYSLDDAARTAIAFGIINALIPIPIKLLSIIFKIKKFKLPISPVYKDGFFIHSEINCIFTISIAKTIYITFLLINSYIKIKGDELAREDI